MRQFALFAIVIMFFLPPVESFSVDEEGNIQIQERIELKFKVAEFDPVLDPIPLPDYLKTTDYGYYIIQFDGPIMREWIVELEYKCKVYDYIPNYAYIVRAKSMDELREVPHVRFIGIFHPGYKIMPQIIRDSDIPTIYIALYFDDVDVAVRELEITGFNVFFKDRFMIKFQGKPSSVIKAAFLPHIKWIEEAYPIHFFNNKASRICKIRQTNDGIYTGVGSLWSYNSNTGMFEGYAGTNVTVAVLDTGVDGSHPAFNGKKKAYYSYGGQSPWTDSNGHGTHTSGSVLGNGAWRAGDSGTPGKYAGMAPNASLVGQAFGQTSFYTILNDAVKNNASVSSNSWGSTNYGQYDSSARAYDALVRDSDYNKPGEQRITVVFASGNSGNQGISPPSTAKNVICVGATDNNNGNSIPGFSSRGPTRDGRIKPDVVAPGAYVTSCRANSASSYRTLSGTSMSCPIVAGASAVVYEYFVKVRHYIPSPSMVKAVLINGATPISGYPYPGGAQGWGRLNLAASLLNTSSKQIFAEDLQHRLYTGNGITYTFNITSSSQELKIVLVWMDYPGSTNANPALVNDLDMTLTSPSGSTYKGNVFSYGYSTTGGQHDKKNNVEVIRIKNPQSGKWLLNVHGANIPKGPQDYSIVISGAVSEIQSDRLDVSVLSFTHSPTNLSEGDVVKFFGTIKNSGTLLIKNLKYRITVEMENGAKRVIKEGEVSQLSKNETYNVSCGWVAIRGLHNVILEVDPTDILPENIEKNNNASVSIFVKGYGINLKSDMTKKYGNPGSKISFYLSVKNTGNTIDTYDLVLAENSDGWNVSIEDESIKVGIGSEKNVTCTVEVPEDALADDSTTFSISATSRGNSTYTEKIYLVAKAKQIYSIEIIKNDTEKWAYPSQTVEYTFEIVNKGNGLDKVNIMESTQPPDDWIVVLSESYIQLEPHTSHNISLKVTPPADAIAYSYGEATIAIKSEKTDWSYYTTRTTVYPVPKLYLKLKYGEDSCMPGDDVSYGLSIINSGNCEDTYELKVNLPEDWECELSSDRVTVPQGQTVDIDMTIYVSNDALTENYNLKVEAVSTINSSVRSSVNITLKVEQIYSTEMTLSDSRITIEAGDEKEIEATVRNTGNGNDTLIIYVKDKPSVKWKVKFSDENFVLMPDEEKIVKVTIKVPESTRENIYYIDIVVESQDGAQVVKQSLRVKVKKVPQEEDTSPPPPQPQPYNPPIIDEDEEIQTDNSITAKIMKYKYLLGILLLLLLLVVGAAVVASRSRRRRKALKSIEDEKRKYPEPAYEDEYIVWKQYGKKESTLAYTVPEQISYEEPPSETYHEPETEPRYESQHTEIYQQPDYYQESKIEITTESMPEPTEEAESIPAPEPMDEQIPEYEKTEYVSDIDTEVAHHEYEVVEGVDDEMQEEKKITKVKVEKEKNELLDILTKLDELSK